MTSRQTTTKTTRRSVLAGTAIAPIAITLADPLRPALAAVGDVTSLIRRKDDALARAKAADACLEALEEAISDRCGVPHPDICPFIICDPADRDRPVDPEAMSVWARRSQAYNDAMMADPEYPRLGELDREACTIWRKVYVLTREALDTEPVSWDELARQVDLFGWLHTDNEMGEEGDRRIADIATRVRRLAGGAS